MTSAKAVEHRRIHRRLPGRLYGLRGGARKPLVHVQRHAPMPGRGEERIREALLPVLLEERGGKPGGLIAMQHLPGFLQIARPEHVRRRRAGAVVGEHHSGHLLRETQGPRKAAPARRGSSAATTRVKSCGEAASQSKNGRQVVSACCCSSPWNTIAMRGHCPAGRRSARPNGG